MPTESSRFFKFSVAYYYNIVLRVIGLSTKLTHTQKQEEIDIDKENKVTGLLIKRKPVDFCSIIEIYANRRKNRVS